MRKTLLALFIAGPVLLACGIALFMLTSHPLMSGVAGTLVLAAILFVGAAVRLWLTERKSGAPAAGSESAPVASLHSQLDQCCEFLLARYQDRGIDDLAKELTWLIVLGPQGCGKSALLRGAGFNELVFELRDENGNVSVVDSIPPNCRFWECRATSTIVLEFGLDPNGGLMRPDAATSSRDLRKHWRQLLSWLRKRKLISAVMVLTAIDALEPLLVQAKQELDRYGSEGKKERLRMLLSNRLERRWPQRLRERVDEISHALRVRLPIHVVFTGADRIPGFVPFFRHSRDLSSYPWGITIADATSLSPVALGAQVAQRLERLVDDLRERAHDRLAAPGGAAYAALRFPAEFASRTEEFRAFVEVFSRRTTVQAAQQGLRAFVRRLFVPQEPPWLCSLCLTSAHQGGEPLAPLARPELYAPLPGRGEIWLPNAEETRPYFLDLFALIQNGLRREPPQPLPVPLWPKQALAIAVVFAVAVLVARHYRPERLWLRLLTAHVESLGKKQPPLVAGVQPCYDSLAEQAALLDSCQRAPHTRLEPLRAAAADRLRAHVARYCIETLLPTVKEALQQESGDLLKLPPLDEARTAELYNAFTTVARLNKEMSGRCPAVKADPQDHKPLLEQLKAWHVRQATDPERPAAGPQLEQVLDFFLQGHFSSSEARVSIPKDLMGSALWAAQRLERQTPERLYLGIGSADARGRKSDELATGFYSYKAGCQVFDEMLTRQHWLRCVSLQHTKDEGSARAKYRLSYREAWKDFVRETLWQSVRKQLPQSPLWDSPCPSPRVEYVRGKPRLVGQSREQVALDPLDRTEALRSLGRALQQLPGRLRQLSASAPPLGAARKSYCRDVAEPLLGFTELVEPAPGQPARNVSAAFANYLKAVDAMSTALTPVVQAQNGDPILRFANETGARFLNELMQRRKELADALKASASDTGQAEAITWLDETLRIVEQEIDTLVKRIAADVAKTTVWGPFAQQWEPARVQLSSPECISRLAAMRALKSTFRDVVLPQLRPFCRRIECGGMPVTGGATQVLSWSSELMAWKSRYMDTPDETCPLPAAAGAAPAPAPPAPAPAPAAPSPPASPQSIEPVRVEFYDCMDSNFTLRFKDQAQHSILCKAEHQADSDAGRAVLRMRCVRENLSQPWDGSGDILLYAQYGGNRELPLLENRDIISIRNQCSAQAQGRIREDSPRVPDSSYFWIARLKKFPLCKDMARLRVYVHNHSCAAPSPEAPKVPAAPQAIAVPSLPMCLFSYD